MEGYNTSSDVDLARALQASECEFNAGNLDEQLALFLQETEERDFYFEEDEQLERALRESAESFHCGDTQHAIDVGFKAIESPAAETQDIHVAGEDEQLARALAESAEAFHGTDSQHKADAGPNVQPTPSPPFQQEYSNQKPAADVMKYKMDDVASTSVENNNANVSAGVDPFENSADASDIESFAQPTFDSEFAQAMQASQAETAESRHRQAAQIIQNQIDAESRLAEQQDMEESVYGKSIALVHRIVELVHTAEDIFPLLAIRFDTVATDDVVFLSKRMLELQHTFQTMGTPSFVDTGYHYTNRENLNDIRENGLLSKSERQLHNIQSARTHGAVFGDGIYTANNPSSFSGYGSVGLIVGRMQGKRIRVAKCLRSNGPIMDDVNTVIGNKLHHSHRLNEVYSDGWPLVDKFHEIVLRNSAQCLPLIWYDQPLLASEERGMECIQYLQTSVQVILDDTFNQGVSQDSSTPPLMTPTSPRTLGNTIARARARAAPVSLTKRSRQPCATSSNYRRVSLRCFGASSPVVHTDVVKYSNEGALRKAIQTTFRVPSTSAQEKNRLIQETMNLFHRAWKNSRSPTPTNVVKYSNEEALRKAIATTFRDTSTSGQEKNRLIQELMNLFRTE